MSEEGSGDAISMSVEVLFEVHDEPNSPEDPPRSEWSSLEISIPEANLKKILYSQGLYSPGSGDVCAKQVRQSGSWLLDHPYYDYPAILDPGIKEALTLPEKTKTYPDDGQELYLTLCKEKNLCPVRIFHRGLLNAEINLSYYGVNPQGVRAMARALEYNNHVTRFNLASNFLNDDACYHLGQMLHNNTTLLELLLPGCRMGPSGIYRLGESLPMNRCLVYLDISNNCLSDAGGVHFANQLSNGAYITRVNLSKNNLGQNTALALADVWEWKNKFTHLDLSWNQFFHEPSCAKMLYTLSLSIDLEELNLSGNGLKGERIAKTIAKILSISTLVSLDLSRNGFKDESVEIIADNLENVTSLLTLDLSFNPLTPSDAYKVLQKMLKFRIRIKNLYMEGIAVRKPFLDLLATVKMMKNRKRFVCTYDTVLQNWTVEDPDPRVLLLKRADFLARSSTINNVDFGLYLLALDKEFDRPISTKELQERAVADTVPLDENLIKEMSYVFAGPPGQNTRTINLKSVADFVHRLWPDKQLPPPPEPEPEALPPPPRKKGKGKK